MAQRGEHGGSIPHSQKHFLSSKEWPGASREENQHHLMWTLCWKGGGESTPFPLAFNTSSFSLSCVEYLDLPFPYPQVYQIALDVIGVTY